MVTTKNPNEGKDIYTHTKGVTSKHTLNSIGTVIMSPT